MKLRMIGASRTYYRLLVNYQLISIHARLDLAVRGSARWQFLGKAWSF